MRVISGERRGLKLAELPDSVSSRPTIDSVKEAMFDIVRFRLGERALDLFGGTGQLGIEALSNGCKTAVICDNDENALKLIKKNVERAGYGERAKVLLTDYKRFIKTAAKKNEFDTIFLDPPFDSPLLVKALGYIDEYSILKKDGVVIAECPADKSMPEAVGSLVAEKRFKYGAIAVVLYTNNGKEAADE